MLNIYIICKNFYIKYFKIYINNIYNKLTQFNLKNSKSNSNQKQTKDKNLMENENKDLIEEDLQLKAEILI